MTGEISFIKWTSVSRDTWANIKSDQLDKHKNSTVEEEAGKLGFEIVNIEQSAVTETKKSSAGP